MRQKSGKTKQKENKEEERERREKILKDVSKLTRYCGNLERMFPICAFGFGIMLKNRQV